LRKLQREFVVQKGSINNYIVERMRKLGGKIPRKQRISESNHLLKEVMGDKGIFIEEKI